MMSRKTLIVALLLGLFACPGLKAEAVDRQAAAKWIRFGKKLMSEKRLDDAIVAFDKALEYEPDSAAAETGLGDCYEAKGDLANAVKHYKLGKGTEDEVPPEKAEKIAAPLKSPAPSEDDDDKPIEAKKSKGHKKGKLNRDEKLEQIEADIEAWEDQAHSAKIWFWGGCGFQTIAIVALGPKIENGTYTQNPIQLPLLLLGGGAVFYGGWNWWEANSELSTLRAKKYDLSLVPLINTPSGDPFAGIELSVRFGS